MELEASGVLLRLPMMWLAEDMLAEYITASFPYSLFPVAGIVVGR